MVGMEEAQTLALWARAAAALQPDGSLMPAHRCNVRLHRVRSLLFSLCLKACQQPILNNGGPAVVRRRLLHFKPDTHCMYMRIAGGCCCRGVSMLSCIVYMVCSRLSAVKLTSATLVQG